MASSDLVVLVTGGCLGSRVQEVTANKVMILDSKGHPRLIPAAPLDPPRVSGKEYPRSASDERLRMAIDESDAPSIFVFDSDGSVLWKAQSKKVRDGC